MRRKLVLNGSSLSITALNKHLSLTESQVSLSKSSLRSIKNSSRFFDYIQKADIHCYGQNTSFGNLIRYKIPLKYQDDLQTRLVMSHAAGIRDTLSLKLARSVFLLRLNYLAKGVSGVRPETINGLVFLYNSGAYPEIYKTGSLGASGDLAPLSHFAAFSIGKGWGYFKKKRQRSADIHRRLGISPLKLKRKEGLSLINGTSAMVAIGIEAISKIALYLETTIIIMGLILNSTNIPKGFLFFPAYKLKNYYGSSLVAKYLCALVELTDRNLTKKQSESQAPYSFRCAPFILGPLIETIIATRKVLETEMNSANDNPIFLNEHQKLYHGGHFHGLPVAIYLDFLRIASTHLSGIIDRQLDLLVDSNRSYGLPPFLSCAPEKGFCGFEGLQYLATSLHIEIKNLSYPLSNQTIPTNAGNQDYVCLGMQSALSALEIADNLKYLVSIYIATACQIQFLSPRSLKNSGLLHVLRLIKSKNRAMYRDGVLVNRIVQENASDEYFAEICRTIHSSLKNIPRISDYGYHD